MSKLIVEIVLLGRVESVTSDETDAHIAAAGRHSVDVAKVRQTVTAEFAAKQAKTAAKLKQPVKKTTAKTSKAA